MPRRKRKAGIPPIFRQRVDKLRERIGTWETDALLVTNPRDIRYLTGFVGDDSWMIVRAAKPDVTVITDFRYDEQVEREAPHVKVVVRKGAIVDPVEKLLKRFRIKRLGVQAEYMRVGTRKGLAKKVGSRTLKDVQDKLIEQRAIKDAREVARIRKAVDIQQRAFLATVKTIKPGQTEQAITAELLYQMRTLGADKESFDPIVAADANAALPHATPGSDKVRKGGILLIDWGAMYEGYRSDMTRTLALGTWPRKMKEIYKVVLDAQLAAIDKIAPGVALKDVDAAARNVIKKAGYAKQFGHGLGHGIGLDIHEEPRLGKKSEGELQVNQVVTVEPGIYLPGVGGVRLEDDVLVTARGHEVLCDLPKDLESAII